MRAAAAIVLVLLSCFLAKGACCAHGSEEAPSEEGFKKIVFIPQWQPQAQFAGYYVAQDKGLYRKHGLEVEVLQGGPGRPSAEWLRSGAAQFGSLFLSTAILERSRGVRLINLAQIVQRSSQLLIAKRSSRIQSLREMDGKRVGLWGAELSLVPLALFRRLGVQPVVVPQSSTVSLFLRGGVDAASAMWYNEYHTLLSAGVDPEELVVFRLADSIAFPEDGIYCLEETYRSDPEQACRFARASIEGWRYAFEHEEEALDIVMKRVDEAQVATNRVHQRWMLKCMRDLIQPSRPEVAVGALFEADYTAVASVLEGSGLTGEAPPLADFHVTCVDTHEK